MLNTVKHDPLYYYSMYLFSFCEFQMIELITENS